MREAPRFAPSPTPWLRIAMAAGAWCLSAAASALPAQVEKALQQAHVPDSAVSVVLQEVGAKRALLAQNADRPMNPASLTKLLTTLAAFDQLGPAWRWSTPVWLDGRLQDGVLEGSLFIKGSGDPQLVVERVWLLLRRVQQMGVHEIRGDIVLDRSAFAAVEGDSADFDGDPTRPYNVLPDALLLNFKSVTYSFVPEPERGVARVLAEPPLAGTRVDTEVRLAAGPCADWRGALKASFDEPLRVHFAGAYPLSCGERAWPVADADPQSYNARLIQALWRDMGGKLSGAVRDGAAPTGIAPTFEMQSPSLAEVVYDINKFSNNVMAQQLFLTLALQRQPSQPASADAARDNLRQWLLQRVGELPAGTQLDNGSGLSRSTRLSAALLARLLQQAFASATMPELLASLPINGLDGTLRRSRASPGRAHLKTGSLRGVIGVAGFVLAENGRRYVLVALVNHPNAGAARPALDALLQWALQDADSR